MTDEHPPETRGHIRDVGFLDLGFAKTPEDLDGITAITDVGMILIPENLAGALAKIPMSDVGGIVPIPQDAKVNCLTGQVRIDGDALAAGDPETILVVAGQIFITGEVTTVGYKELRVFGQMFAPRNSRAAISAKLAQLSGQNFFLPGEARMIMGQQTIGQEFLELLPEPTALVVLGQVNFEGGVTKELIQSKLTEIVLMGQIYAPKELLQILEVITKEKMGQIVAA